MGRARSRSQCAMERMFGATCNAAPVTRSVDVGTAGAVATSAASPVPREEASPGNGSHRLERRASWTRKPGFPNAVFFHPGLAASRCAETSAPIW